MVTGARSIAPVGTRASPFKPGGLLCLAEGHPSAFVFDDAAQLPNGLPSFSLPYFVSEPLVKGDASDYANDAAVLTKVRTYSVRLDIYTWLTYRMSCLKTATTIP